MATLQEQGAIAGGGTAEGVAGGVTREIGLGFDDSCADSALRQVVDQGFANQVSSSWTVSVGSSLRRRRRIALGRGIWTHFVTTRVARAWHERLGARSGCALFVSGRVYLGNIAAGKLPEGGALR